MDNKVSIHEPTSVIDLTKEMRRKLCDLPHYFRQIVQDGKLTTDIIDIVAPENNDIWAASPKGALGRPTTVQQAKAASAATPPTVPRSSAATTSGRAITPVRTADSDVNQIANQIASSQQATSRSTKWESFKDHVNKFALWTLSCMNEDTASRVRSNPKLKDILDRYDIVQYIFEVRNFIANGTRGNARNLFEGLIKEPRLLVLASIDDFTNHLDTYRSAVECLEVVGSTYGHRDTIRGLLESLGEEFESIKAVLIERMSRDPDITLHSALDSVQCFFDISLLDGKGKLKTKHQQASPKQPITGTEAYRVNVTNETQIKCRYFSRGDSCYKGDACPFRHSQEDLLATMKQYRDQAQAAQREVQSKRKHSKSDSKRDSKRNSNRGSQSGSTRRVQFASDSESESDSQEEDNGERGRKQHSDRNGRKEQDRKKRSLF